MNTHIGHPLPEDASDALALQTPSTSETSKQLQSLFSNRSWQALIDQKVPRIPADRRIKMRAEIPKSKEDSERELYGQNHWPHDAFMLMAQLQPEKGKSAFSVMVQKGVRMEVITDLFDRVTLLCEINDNAFSEFIGSVSWIQLLDDMISRPELTKSEIEERICTLDMNPYQPGWMPPFESLLGQHVFDPESEIKTTLRLPRAQKKKAYEDWKNQYEIQLIALSQIPAAVKWYLFDEKNIENGSFSEIMHSCITEITPLLFQCSTIQKLSVIWRLRQYVERALAVRWYAKEYAGRGAELLTTCIGIDMREIHGPIDMVVNSANFTFYVHESRDYETFYAHLAKLVWDESWNHATRGVATYHSSIEELQWTITLQRGENVLENIHVETHETAHIDNLYRMSDLYLEDGLVRAKDEIIAYFSTGTHSEEIFKRLSARGEKALYDFYAPLRETESQAYGEIGILYERELRQTVIMAERLRLSGLPNYLDLLAVTPVRRWDRLAIFFAPEDVPFN